MNKKKLYSLNQCALYKCSSKKKLAVLLQTDINIFKNISSITNYKNFQVSKKGSSETRTITAPQNEIKKLQSKVFKLLQKVSRPDWLISSQLGKSYIDNGKSHLDSKFLLTIDIKQFYDNCSREYVYNFFRFRLLTPPDISKILTDIVTFEGGVFCKTFLHNIAKKKYTLLRLKFFSDYFGLDRAFLSRKLSPVKLKMCA